MKLSQHLLSDLSQSPFCTFTSAKSSECTSEVNCSLCLVLSIVRLPCMAYQKLFTILYTFYFLRFWTQLKASLKLLRTLIAILLEVGTFPLVIQVQAANHSITYCYHIYHLSIGTVTGGYFTTLLEFLENMFHNIGIK